MSEEQQDYMEVVRDFIVRERQAIENHDLGAIDDLDYERRAWTWEMSVLYDIVLREMTDPPYTTTSQVARQRAADLSNERLRAVVDSMVMLDTEAKLTVDALMHSPWIEEWILRRGREITDKRVREIIGERLPKDRYPRSKGGRPKQTEAYEFKRISLTLQ
jgi:hypothetical protein